MNVCVWGVKEVELRNLNFPGNLIDLTKTVGAGLAYDCGFGIVFVYALCAPPAHRHLFSRLKGSQSPLRCPVIIIHTLFFIFSLLRLKNQPNRPPPSNSLNSFNQRDSNIHKIDEPSSFCSAAMDAHNGDHVSQAHRPQQQQQMTIFYNGTVCACDVTEFQARAIMRLASKAVEERTAISPSLQRPSQYTPVPAAAQTPAVVVTPAPAAPPAMRRSLQRFLEKRSHRIHAASPRHQ
ncbi:hypothetical protein Ancab_021411 [Ancistrocladus abbreviatus]